jgi:WD40 repeat protein
MVLHLLQKNKRKKKKKKKKKQKKKKKKKKKISRFSRFSSTMKKVVCESSFIGVGANLVSSCVAWQPVCGSGGDMLAAFGAGSSVALFSLARNAIVETFCGALSEVNKVRWLDEKTLFACCNKGLLIVEELGKKVRFEAVSISSEQQFHGLGVVPNARGKGVALVVLSGTHLVSFVFDSKARTCTAEENVITLPQRQLSECVSGILLPRSKISVFAVGGADRKIHLYVDEERKVIVLLLRGGFFV